MRYRTGGAEPGAIRWGLVLLLFLLAPYLGVPFVRAEEETPTPVEEEEPVLEGEAKKAHLKEVKRLVKQLKDGKNREFVARRIELMGTEGTRASRDALMQFATRNKNQQYVDHSLRALAGIGGKKSIEFLCGKNALRSKHFLVQHSAAEALASARDERAVGPLLDVMTSKRTKIKVVGACALALGQSAGTDERVVDVLFKYSRHRKDTIRSYAVEALGYLATDEAVARLTEVLEGDKNTRVREYAAMGFGHTRRSDVIPLLKKALSEETAFTVRDACMRAIRMLQRSP